MKKLRRSFQGFSKVTPILGGDLAGWAVVLVAVDSAVADSAVAFYSWGTRCRKCHPENLWVGIPSSSEGCLSRIRLG